MASGHAKSSTMSNINPNCDGEARTVEGSSYMTKYLDGKHVDSYPDFTAAYKRNPETPYVSYEAAKRQEDWERYNQSLADKKWLNKHAAKRRMSE